VDLNLRSEPEPQGFATPCLVWLLLSSMPIVTPIFADIINIVITTSLDRNKFQACVGLRIALCISWDNLDVVPSQWAYK
jgi:hypothetical protein